MILFLFLLLAPVIFWFVIFFFINDFAVPTHKSLKKYKKVLLIFPHADDEVFGSGGLLHILSKTKTVTTAAILTKGERGTPNGELNVDLKDIRVKESQQAAKLLGISKVVHEDFGDGELCKKKPQIKTYISELIEKGNPDLIITYDLAGLYGHPDHIACSEVITDLLQTTYTDIDLWYTTQPKRLLRMVKLPEHMAKDPEFRKKRTIPSHKVFIGHHVIPKIQAVYANQSQFEGFRKAVPFKAVPLWFFYSTGLWEYFHEVKK